jgi:hypothetical protein
MQWHSSKDGTVRGPNLAADVPVFHELLRFQWLLFSICYLLICCDTYAEDWIMEEGGMDIYFYCAPDTLLFATTSSWVFRSLKHDIRPTFWLI